MNGSAPQPTKEQLTYGLRLIRIAIAGSVGFIALITILFLTLTDIPPVPLVPIAVFVIVFDLAFLVVITRSRRAAIRRADEREGGAATI